MYPIFLFYIIWVGYNLYYEYTEFSTEELLQASYFRKADASLQHLDLLHHIPHNESIEIYHLEHVLASWVSQQRPWHAYHSALGLKTTTGVHLTIDFAPRKTTSVASIIHPKRLHFLPYLHPRAKQLMWENDGAILIKRNDAFDKKYTQVSKIGSINNTQGQLLSRWVNQYASDHRSFEPYEVRVGDALIHPSSMCHDFTTEALIFMVDNKFVPISAGEQRYRDRIILYVETFEKVDAKNETVFGEIVNFFKLLDDGMVKINEDFSSIRDILKSAREREISPYLYSNGSYYRAMVATPWVNYCYTEHSKGDTRCFLH